MRLSDTERETVLLWPQPTAQQTEQAGTVAREHVRSWGGPHEAVHVYSFIHMQQIQIANNLHQDSNPSN